MSLPEGPKAKRRAKEPKASLAGKGPCVVLICSAYADGRAGQTIVLDSLLSGADTEIVLVSLRGGPGLDAVDGHFAEVVFLPEEMPWYAENGPVSAMDDSLLGRATAFNRCAGLLFSIESWAASLVDRFAGRAVTSVVGCSGSHADLGVGAKLAAALEVPFVAYLFDDPVYQWTEEHLERPSALLQERVWAPAAAAILVANEELARQVQARNPDLSEPAVIHNPVPTVRKREALPRPARGPDQPWIIAYTGSVYHAQADAFRNLVAALDWIDEPWEFHVASQQSEEAMRLNGLDGAHVRARGALSQEQALDLQGEADVLFLPLAFEVIPDVIRTSAPLKTGEYLSSGRPVLVHAPADSWLSRFVREHGCGLVVDRPSVALLAAGLLKLRRDADLRADLVRRQDDVASEFGLVAARESFWSILETVSSRAATSTTADGARS